MNKKYIGALDQGTTSTRFIVFDHRSQIIASQNLEHKQYYPHAGWVEHDAEEIWEATRSVIKQTLSDSGISGDELAALGITNQRETLVVWDPQTGKPYHRAIVWQDTRTDELCQKLSDKYGDEYFRDKTGLPPATYFSGPKLTWLLQSNPQIRKAAQNGRAICGTIDTWLLWQLSGGASGGVHYTDITNASRTMLMDLKSLAWDDELLKIMQIPSEMLPQIRSCSEEYARTTKAGIFSTEIPIAGILGDQQAALFGQTCFSVGEAKNTYGTGCFLLMNTGEKPVSSKSGLITTAGYKLGKEKAVYALEGSIAMAGSLVQWFRDNFGLISTSGEIETLASEVDDNGGLYFVPAFSGLFAPYWNAQARGLIIGLTHYNNKSHIARAILEATAFQTKDVFEAMQKDTDISIPTLKVDGGMTVNHLLMQFQSDLLAVPVIKPNVSETTALGAAYAAGLAVGFWDSKEALRKNWIEENRWLPNIDDSERKKLYSNWQRAVKRSLDWRDR
jgi:glycerol kinase